MTLEIELSGPTKDFELRKKIEKLTNNDPLLNNHVIELIKSKFPKLNKDQLKAIQITDGPLQIIAGPGSGKTLVLVLRTLYLLLSGYAKPHQILLTTFTEKAAFEIRDRLHHYAMLCGYLGPLYDIKVGTIHSICNNIIREYVSYVPLLKKNYLVLDGLMQHLFLNENFDAIIEQEMNNNGSYFGKWNYKWSTIREIIPYFNKISEEALDVRKFCSSGNPFLISLGKAYGKYTEVLFRSNRIDHAYQQKIVYELLQNPELLEKIKNDITYIMVDEYQDTNYVQEQILLQLAHPSNNICIVGDEDQSLYRFRGATPRNILEFHTHFQNCHKIALNINYRSHQNIINTYNHFMESVDWSNPNGAIDFRFNKVVKADPSISFSDYPAVFSIYGTTKQDEGAKFAQLVKYLKDNNIIEDYSDVALLLHSVRPNNSINYIQALEKLSIPYFAPRARKFFENEEILLMIGCYALLFNFCGDAFSDTTSFTDLRIYVGRALDNLRLHSQTVPQLEQHIQRWKLDIANLKVGETSDLHLVDFFYELLAYPPFSSFQKNEINAKNLAKLSKLLTSFQNYYHIDVITERNRLWIPNMLFSSFLKFLLDYGIDDYQDSSNPVPKGYVQIMTVHQSKGLEFPVVVVGSLDEKRYSIKSIDRELCRFYNRVEFEPEHRINEFDSMRQYYVAFSRAAKILVMTTTNQPNHLVSSIFKSLYQWPQISKSLLCNQKFKSKDQFILKRSYSLTSHINTFEICPQKYQFYIEYEFSPSRSATRTFGNLVHQTIEDIHKMILNGRLGDITNEIIRDELFEPNYRSLVSIGMRSLSLKQKNAALDHILDYFNQNYDNLRKVTNSELEISVERPGYILTGKIDLLLKDNGKFEILDFKTEQKPKDDDPLLQRYFKQLYTYAYLLKERYGIYPQRLYIYWSSERNLDQALMEVPFSNNDAISAGAYFDNIVNVIQKKEFKIKRTPEVRICGECDFRRYCVAQGLIKQSTHSLTQQLGISF